MPSPLDASLGNLRNFVGVLREISFDELRDAAERTPRLLILAPGTTEAREVGLALTGGAGELAITARELQSPPSDLAQFDAVVVRDPTRTGAAQRLRDRQSTSGAATTVVSFDAPDPADPDDLEMLRNSIVRLNLDRAPAFGRAFPVFRDAAAKAVINETTIANAQFALLSNVPALIPLVGGLASASADFLVLTKNQVMMMYKLGAIYDRDLYDQVAILQELAPVVGAGFLWRTVARAGAAMLPFAAGTVPRVAIAFIGTMIVGRAADYYYRTGLRPNKEQVNQFRQQAADLLAKAPIPALSRILRGDSGEMIDVEGRVVDKQAGPDNLRYFSADAADPADQQSRGR